MKVFLSTYACEPGKGSEPEVGWRVATEMARHCTVRALTRSNNRESIERELRTISDPKPEFLYYDLPPSILRLKGSLLNTSLYYALWQIAARWRFRNELRSTDLIHHVTFNGVQFPGVWIGTGKPVVLGPLGGGMTCPKSMLPLLGKQRRKERLRTWLIGCLRFMPWWRLTLCSASRVLAANQETAAVLRRLRREPVPVMLETAIPSDQIIPQDRITKPSGTFKVLWLGQLIPRKAPILAIHALANALKSNRHIRLVIAGSGPEEARLRDEALRLEISDHVDFKGRVPKADIPDLMDDSDAFLFTSVRDTSGNVVLEAMSRALPVVAVWHQGIREICGSESALLVEASEPEVTAAALAECLLRLTREDDLAPRIGNSGKERLKLHFTWQAYINRMLSEYRMAVVDLGE